MEPSTLVYRIPNPEEWYTKPIPGYTWVFTSDYLYVISDENLDYPTTTIKELIRNLGYNPFEQSAPTPENELLMLEIAAGLDYLTCLADLGLLGGGLDEST